MPEIQNTLTLPTPDEILLARIEALMTAVRLLHPLLDLLEEGKTNEQSGAARDLTEILKSLYTTTIASAAMVQEIDVRTQSMAQEIRAIREALQIPIE
jgi:hypothetical protein